MGTRVEGDRALQALRANLWPAGTGGAAKGRLVVIFLMSLASSTMAAAGPLFLRRLIGELSRPALMVPLLLVLAYPAVRFAGLATIQLRVMMTAAVMEGVKARFAATAFEHILALGRDFHLERNTGALARVLERGAAGLESSIRSTHVVVFQVLLEAALVCGVLARVISWRFGLLLLAVMVGYAVVAIVFTQRQVRWRRAQNAEESRANGLAFESLHNWDLVRAFGRQGYETARFAAAKHELARVARRVQAQTSGMFIAWQALEGLAMAGILSLAVGEVAAGRMRLADLVLAQVYLLQVFANMTGLGLVYNTARQGYTDLAELQALLDRPHEADGPKTGPEGALNLVVTHGEVVFDRVSFGYEGGDGEADRDGNRGVREVSLAIPPGRTLALVGASGAGKTTLARLLLRLHDPQGGAIRIDGHDLRDVSRASLAAQIGVVAQDTQLFNETIAYNIRYGRPDASDAEVAQAARQAVLSDFIEALPLGYRTLVGERGLKLSGGERQRLAIARLFLARPAVLVFDEATSSVDSLVEAEIQASLRRVAAGRTTLVIAHRLSTIADADEIAVLDAGRVVERGDHHALLARGGLYARLWCGQAALAAGAP